MRKNRNKFVVSFKISEIERGESFGIPRQYGTLISLGCGFLAVESYFLLYGWPKSKKNVGGMMTMAVEYQFGDGYGDGKFREELWGT